MFKFLCTEMWRREKGEMKWLLEQGGTGGEQKLNFSYSKKNIKKDIKRKALRMFNSSKARGDVLPPGFESILIEVGALGAFEYYG